MVKGILDVCCYWRTIWSHQYRCWPSTGHYQDQDASLRTAYGKEDWTHRYMEAGPQRGGVLQTVQRRSASRRWLHRFQVIWIFSFRAVLHQVGEERLHAVEAAYDGWA